tara:strand:- start:118 stop:408 length:291 start_codon:yes stop_codon:yes gene_type:complete
LATLLDGANLKGSGDQALGPKIAPFSVAFDLHVAISTQPYILRDFSQTQTGNHSPISLPFPAVFHLGDVRGRYRQVIDLMDTDQRVEVSISTEEET